MKSSSTVRVFRPVDAHRTPFSFSSLDAPLFEVHLCELERSMYVCMYVCTVKPR